MSGSAYLETAALTPPIIKSICECARCRRGVRVSVRACLGARRTQARAGTRTAVILMTTRYTLDPAQPLCRARSQR